MQCNSPADIYHTPTILDNIWQVGYTKYDIPRKNIKFEVLL